MQGKKKTFNMREINKLGTVGVKNQPILLAGKRGVEKEKSFSRKSKAASHTPTAKVTGKRIRGGCTCRKKVSGL